MPEVLVNPRRGKKLELSLVSDGFLRALEDYFTWVDNKEAEKPKGALTTRYFLQILEFNRLPKRRPDNDELADLKILAKTVEGYRLEARQNPVTYSDYWNKMPTKGKLKLMQLNQQPNSAGVQYLIEAFELEGVTTASPDQFTPSGIGQLENVIGDLSTSPDSNVYDVVEMVYETVNDPFEPREDIKYAEFFEIEHLPDPGVKGGPPEIPPDPGPGPMPETPPDIPEPDFPIEGV